MQLELCLFTERDMGVFGGEADKQGAEERTLMFGSGTAAKAFVFQ